MKNILLIALVAALSMSGAGCKNKSKEEQLAALDSAYKSGVLTQQEYEAKKAALLGPATAPPAQSATDPSATEPAPTSTAAPNRKSGERGKKTFVSRSAAKLEASGSHYPAPNPPDSETGVVKPPIENAPIAAPSKSPKVSHADEEETHAVKGCEDVEAKAGKEKGEQERFFAAPLSRVRQATLSALKSLDFNIHKESDLEIEASKRHHMGILKGSGG